MKRIVLGLSILIACASFFPQQSLAAERSLTISSDKTSLSGDEEMTVSASASDFDNGELVYIKGAFYKEGTSNYFGYTKNGDNWTKNGDSNLSQKSFTNGNWDENLVIKSDFSNSGFTGNGEYKFKLGFYYLTSGGNLSPVNWSSNSVTIILTAPTPTPSPAPTNTPTPTLKSTPTPTVSTQKPSLSPTLPNSPTQKPLPTKEILGDEAKSPSSFSTPTSIQKQKTIVADAKISPISIIFISIGSVCLLACGILGYLKYEESKK